MEKSAVFVWQVEREKYFHVSEKQKEALIVQKIIIAVLSTVVVIWNEIISRNKAFESDYSPWKSNYEEMAKKTVIKQALKYAPIKTEFQRALSTDETIKSRLSSDMATEVENEMVYENSEMELNK